MELAKVSNKKSFERRPTRKETHYEAGAKWFTFIGAGADGSASLGTTLAVDGTSSKFIIVCDLALAFYYS
jgi:hypothetical protein